MKSYKLLDLLDEASKLSPKLISDEMIYIKRTLDIEAKINTLRDSKVILADYLDLFEYLEDDKKNILANTLLQILSYISSTSKSSGALERFRKGKIKSFDEKSAYLSSLHQKAKELLRFFKARKEINGKLNTKSKISISKNNLFKHLQTLEDREEIINSEIDYHVTTFFHQLKETKAIIAAIGIK